MRTVDALTEIKDCFGEYTASVLSERAIPDSRDGLLDVHRKILFTMEDVLKMTNKSKTKKSASVVGSCLSAAYVHGDASCYGALCKMAQSFLMRYPLVTGQGSLGSQESNNMYAAARYTEAKPSEYADAMFVDYKKETVEKVLSYNNEIYEPTVLPALLPNAIVNGREAIAVGLAHNSLPHNLNETCEAIMAYIKNPEITMEELMDYIKGPDFPLGGVIINSKDIKEAFETGKSKVSLKVRGDYEIKGNDIIFTSIPYRCYRDKIREQIAKNIDDLEKVIDDFRDESNLGKNRLVFTVAKGSTVEQALNKLFEKTDLQTTLSYNMNFLVNGTPKLCSMKDLIESYCKHQDSVIWKSTKFDSDKAEARLHIVEGLLVAVEDIDKIIKLIRNAENRGAAAKSLSDNYPQLSEIQIKAILDMKLASLTKLDGVKLKEEADDLKKKIAEFKTILENKGKRDEILTDKLIDLKKKYGDERRTKLENIDVKKEQKAVPAESCIVTLYNDGTIKRSKKVATRERNTSNAKVLKTINANTMEDILIFTDTGKVHKCEISKISEDKRQKVNLICSSLGSEKPMYILIAPEDVDNKYVGFFTTNGMFKKTKLSEYAHLKQTRTKGIVATKIKEGDSLKDVLILEDEQVLVGTKNGYVIRFNTGEVNPIGRATTGVISIKLIDGDEVSSISKVKDGQDEVVFLFNDGHGKKMELKSLPIQIRGGRGNRVSKGSGLDLIKLCSVRPTDSLLLQGRKEILTVKVEDINLIDTKGVGTFLTKDELVDALVLD